MAPLRLPEVGDARAKQRQLLNKQRLSGLRRTVCSDRRSCPQTRVLSVLEAIRSREPRREALQTQLTGLEEVRDFRPANTARFERQLRAKLADWRGLLRGAPQAARQVLRALLTERVTFTPTVQGGRRVYRYRGTFTVGALFAGEVCPQMLASPTGLGRLWTVERLGFLRVA